MESSRDGKALSTLYDGVMSTTAVTDIHELRGLLEGAATLHGRTARAANRDDHSVIEDFVRLIRNSPAASRRGVVAPV